MRACEQYSSTVQHIILVGDARCGAGTGAASFLPFCPLRNFPFPAGFIKISTARITTRPLVTPPSPCTSLPSPSSPPYDSSIPLYTDHTCPSRPAPHPAPPRHSALHSKHVPLPRPTIPPRHTNVLPSSSHKYTILNPPPPRPLPHNIWSYGPCSIHTRCKGKGGGWTEGPTTWERDGMEKGRNLAVADLYLLCLMPLVFVKK